MNNRKCGTCTKCCEGYLEGDVLGHPFSRGIPCHFISINKGCTIYSKRPENPCRSYKCLWLSDMNIPEWLKPEMSNVILDFRQIEQFSYLCLIEAGSVVSSKVLNWFIQYVISNQLNAVWEVEGGSNYLGSPEFVETIKKQQPKI